VDIGKSLLVSLVESNDIVLYHKLGLQEKMFFGDEVDLFTFIHSHVKKYSALPNLKTVHKQFTDLPTPIESPQYYSDQVGERFMHRRLNKALSECNEHMKDQDAWTALTVVQAAIADIHSTGARGGLVEFMANAFDYYFGAFNKHQLQGKDQMGVMLGWPYLDTMTKGLRPGDVVSIIGRPAQGKSFGLLYSALYAAREQQYPIMFVSMEMAIIELMERLVAMYASLPMSHIHGYELSTPQKNHLVKTLESAKQEQGKLYLLDGNLSTTVPEIFSLVSQLSPRALFIDGAYLLKHQDSRLDKYRRIESNIEEIKKRAGEFGIPVILSYQFNREAVKKKKGKGNENEAPGLENIAGSDAIGQISSIVLGMFEEESVETMVARQIHLLKGRNGEIGKFTINWGFGTMDFSQETEEDKKKKGELSFF
jgi:replicative DNA helicase